MTYDESWSEQKLDPNNPTDRREIITGYSKKHSSAEKLRKSLSFKHPALATAKSLSSTPKT